MSFFVDVLQKHPLFETEQRVSDLALLEPVTRHSVTSILEDARAMGLNVMVFETFRSQTRQQYLFRMGRTQLQRISTHHYGLACDIVLVQDKKPSWAGDFSFLGQLAVKHHVIWGGNWGIPSKKPDFLDPYHVQRSSVVRQESLFSGTWYPDNKYNPYDDLAVSESET
jgi:hypothetical protein